MPISVWVLMLAQALSMSVAPLMVFSGGLVGSDLAPEPGWATMPLALMVAGTALGVMPLTRLMQSLGRKRVFIVGTVLAGLAALLAAYSISVGSFAFFCIAGLLLGGSLAVAQQYRFAAMEIVSVDRASRATSRVLLGGLIAAYLGPELVVFGQGIGDYLGLATLRADHLPFIGAFVLLSFICLLAMLVLLVGYRNPVKLDVAASKTGRPLTEIFRHPLIWLAIMSSAMGYAMMSFMMTATPLNMHKVIGHNLLDTKWVIQSHIIAMFLPSFFSGWLISRLGHRCLIALGVLAYVVCLGVALSGHQLMHYWWALVLLGIGWNFLFVGGTALLPFCYHPNERFRVQSINEFTVFGTQAVAALSSGWVVNHFGWNPLLGTSMLLVLLIVAVLWLNRDTEVAPLAMAE